MEIATMCHELSCAAEHEGSEVGEYWRALDYMCGYVYLCNDSFTAAFYTEVKQAYEHFKANFELVEEEVTRTYIIKDLRFTG